MIPRPHWKTCQFFSAARLSSAVSNYGIPRRCRANGDVVGTVSARPAESFLRESPINLPELRDANAFAVVDPCRCFPKHDNAAFENCSGKRDAWEHAQPVGMHCISRQSANAKGLLNRALPAGSGAEGIFEYAMSTDFKINEIRAPRSGTRL